MTSSKFCHDKKKNPESFYIKQCYNASGPKCWLSNIERFKVMPVYRLITFPVQFFFYWYLAHRFRLWGLISKSTPQCLFSFVCFPLNIQYTYSSCSLQVLLVIFCIIRKNFWDYGRLALLADQEGLVHKLTPFIDSSFFCMILWSD